MTDDGPGPFASLRKAEGEIEAALALLRASQELLGADGQVGVDLNRSDAPEGWATTTIGAICWVNPAKPSRRELIDDAFVSFVPMAAVDAESGTIVALKRRRAGEVRGTHVAFRKGDVLMARITPSMENGKAAVVRRLASAFGFGSTEFHVLRPLAGVLPEYIFHFIRRAAFRTAAHAQMRGAAGQQRVPVEFMTSAEIPLAPVEEQRRIVSLVDTELGGLSHALGHLHAATAAVEWADEETLQAAVRGRLIDPPPRDVRPSVAEIADLIAEERQRSPVPPRQRPASWTEPAVDRSWDGGPLPTIPLGWMWSSVGFASVQIQYGVNVRSDADATMGVPNIGMQNLHRGIVVPSELRYVSLTDADLAVYALSQGDVLFNRTNSAELVGKAAVFELEAPAVFASYLVRLRVDERLARPHFVAHWINSPCGRAWARGVKADAIGQSNINAKKLAQMPLPLPPLAEQDRICARVQQLRDQGSEMQDRIAMALLEIAHCREAVLERAFSGTLTQPVASPSDEHPTALIARAERELADQIKAAATSRRNEVRMERPSSAELVRGGIERMPSDTFRFADLRAGVAVTYEAIVHEVFVMLEDPGSGLTQVYDREAGEIRLARQPPT